MKKVNELNAEKILKKIEKEKEKIRKTGAKKIGLFGSFVKGEQKKKSDIDFLVEFDKITFNNYFDLLFLLERLFKRKIDLIIEQDLRPELSYVLEETKYVKI
ncbi:MAG TPA: nucleotidyltransferase domain-containing protein [Candidatus Pacearchaeota archaeon]|nr:nucleotidyltransferase domain-containing protein [Candidatus Pacearchaeota archaeon]